MSRAELVHNRVIKRVADPASGRIPIDRRDLRDLTQASLRQRIGVIFQKSLLIDDTIRPSAINASSNRLPKCEKTNAVN